VDYIPITSVIRKDKFVGFDEDFPVWDGWAFWNKMAQNGREGLWIDQALWEEQYAPREHLDVDMGEWREKVIGRYEGSRT
jgi:hypothetical protein